MASATHASAGTRLARARCLLVLLAAAVLLKGISVACVVPCRTVAEMTWAPARMPHEPARSTEADASSRSRAAELSEESLKACLIASEDPEAMERCALLSYELASAEQLVLKRQAAMRYIDSDSY
mmetsp:Transcript_56082/g.130606  ORF Transcript_56082/g.130606 Transcript_56082/m.130606 type:complete len:125 (-) Transcript_56082:157-531(-)